MPAKPPTEAAKGKRGGRTSGTRKGNGAGHGGPAKGGGNRPAQPFTADSPTIVLASDYNHDRDAQSDRVLLRRIKNRIRVDAHLRLAHEINSGDSSMARITAADKALTRIDGHPVQSIRARIITSVEDLSEEELLALAGHGGNPDDAPGE